MKYMCLALLMQRIVYTACAFSFVPYCTGRVTCAGNGATVRLPCASSRICAGIEFVCSDMWRPYIRVIRERCSQAVHILDRFHIVAKMNDALDDVHADEARALARHGREPVLKKSRWCLLKRSENLTTPQKGRLKELLRYNLSITQIF